MWATRVVKWNEHVLRGDLFVKHLLKWHDNDWLQQQRAYFTSESNSLVAGRTGTRLNRGRPQPRWMPGIILAKAVLSERKQTLGGRSFLAINTVIDNARENLQNSWNSFVNMFQFFSPPAHV